MKDQRQPTALARLEELLDPIADLQVEMPDPKDAKMLEDVLAWLTWTYSFLSARKQYHKKRALTQAMLIKMSKTLLSPDEIARVEQEAEDQLVGKLDEEPD